MNQKPTAPTIPDNKSGAAAKQKPKRKLKLNIDEVDVQLERKISP